MSIRKCVPFTAISITFSIPCMPVYTYIRPGSFVLANTQLLDKISYHPAPGHIVKVLLYIRQTGYTLFVHHVLALSQMSWQVQGEHKVFPPITNIYYKKIMWNTNTFFLPLLNFVSKILCHVFIVMLQLHNLLVSKWRQ